MRVWPPAPNSREYFAYGSRLYLLSIHRANAVEEEDDEEANLTELHRLLLLRRSFIFTGIFRGAPLFP